MNYHSPFKPWESNHGKCFDGGSAGAAAAAALYVASNIFSWSEAKKMPKLQAEANEEVLELQKEHYDKITDTQRKKITEALTNYSESVGNLIDGPAFENALPDVPEAAEYVPVDACCMQGSTIECNISHIRRAKAFVEAVNRQNEQNDLIHFLSFDPSFLTNLDIVNKSFQDMMRGILPIGDVIEVVSDQAELSAMQGRLGNSRKTTARDLGISKLRIQAAGREEFRRHTQFLATVVSPQNRQHDIMSMMQSPQDRIQLALAQSQLIQNSLQNKNNSLAQKAPFKLAKLQARLNLRITQLQTRMARAMLTNDFVPNYASVVVPKTSNISGLVGAIGQGISNANSSHFFGPPPLAQQGHQGDNGEHLQNNVTTQSINQDVVVTPSK